jgi:hypothetical protein
MADCPMPLPTDRVPQASLNEPGRDASMNKRLSPEHMPVLSLKLGNRAFAATRRLAN